MAREMKYQSWDRYVKRMKCEVIYPWHKWLNGSMWYLVEGEDYQVKTQDFRAYALDYAANNNVKLKTKVDYDGRALYIKAIGRTSLTGQERIEHFKAYEQQYNKLHGEYEP